MAPQPCVFACHAESDDATAAPVRYVRVSFCGRAGRPVRGYGRMHACWFWSKLHQDACVIYAVCMYPCMVHLSSAHRLVKCGRDHGGRMHARIVVPHRRRGQSDQEEEAEGNCCSPCASASVKASATGHSGAAAFSCSGVQPHRRPQAGHDPRNHGEQTKTEDSQRRIFLLLLLLKQLRGCGLLGSVLRAREDARPSGSDSLRHSQGDAATSVHLYICTYCPAPARRLHAASRTTLR